MLTEKDNDQETASDIVGPEQRVNRQKWPGRGHKTKIKEDHDSWRSVDVGKWCGQRGFISPAQRLPHHRAALSQTGSLRILGNPLSPYQGGTVNGPCLSTLLQPFSAEVPGPPTPQDLEPLEPAKRLKVVTGLPALYLILS